MRLLQRPKQVLYTKKLKTRIHEFNTLLLGIKVGGDAEGASNPIIAMASEGVRKGKPSLLLTGPTLSPDQHFPAELRHILTASVNIC